MKTSAVFLIALICVFADGIQGQGASNSIIFSGYTWNVRQAGQGGPGPNFWDPKNVWVDGNGRLHMAITHSNGMWFCAEIETQKRFGFGKYQFWLEGHPETFDKNIVLGLFAYPTPDVGPDGTHEIDIEFARWGNASYPPGNYTVWPVKTVWPQTSKSFSFALTSDLSTHRFIRSPASTAFQLLEGLRDNDTGRIEAWTYTPPRSALRLSHESQPIHVNLWCFAGRPPSDGKPVEIVVRSFKFSPN